ncbi:MAG: hypothetical protein V5A33_04565 [Halobacteriales archaeon]
MGDVPNEGLIELLYAVDEDQPAAAIVRDDVGPRVAVNTGEIGDPVEYQLSMIAAYMSWLADHTEADLETVADDALEVALEMQATGGFESRVDEQSGE